jgi:hypothetical protein
MISQARIEQFFSEFFRERTAALQRRLAVHHDFWRRFCHEECHFDSRRGTVEKSEGESIVSVTESESEILVITTGDTTVRSRYHVKSSRGKLLIHEVDLEHPGMGWRNWKDTLSSIQPKRAERPGDRSQDEELAAYQCREPAIEQFMAGHFQQRTEARKSEREIDVDFAKRFYSPDCDWNRFLPSVHASEREKILGVGRDGTEVLVVTSGLDLGPGLPVLRLRYHLRPSGQGWLIWEVDTECFLCRTQGRNANCPICGGTIWNYSRLDKFNRPGGTGGDEPPCEGRR